jgi:hypothetical protein
MFHYKKYLNLSLHAELCGCRVYQTLVDARAKKVKKLETFLPKNPVTTTRQILMKFYRKVNYEL